MSWSKLVSNSYCSGGSSSGSGDGSSGNGDSRDGSGDGNPRYSGCDGDDNNNNSQLEA